VKKATV
jgi:hypothetical protein